MGSRQSANFEVDHNTDDYHPHLIPDMNGRYYGPGRFGRIGHMVKPVRTISRAELAIWTTSSPAVVFARVVY
jgi:hypothetical protein